MCPDFGVQTMILDTEIFNPGRRDESAGRPLSLWQEPDD
jgi:hypothetical protein